MTEYNAAVAAVPMPDRIARLRVSANGFPVPWFVADIDGAPDLRVVDTRKVGIAWREKRCWVCGDPLGRTVAFALGPMCTVNRTVSEPPSHRECIEFSVRACPFLANPRMRRNEGRLPEDLVEAPGFGLKRNPAAVAMWCCRHYRPFQAHAGGRGTLWTFGEPTEVVWFTAGRLASRIEVVTAIREGLPALMSVAEQDGPDAVEGLRQRVQRVEPYLPAPAHEGAPA